MGHTAYYYYDFDSHTRFLIGETDPDTGTIQFQAQPRIGVTNAEDWRTFLRKKEIDRFFLIDEPFCIQDEDGEWMSFRKLFPTGW